ncbi:alkylation response protein AidB-like acyl-CoA dehydrogenase [Crossiella equi]|uniref:Alkylation response protein AidB-like acyl-CoA dehydrogenase n=1 Tax=Crossiella equi TaxID=130796 RepID=A0ABS5ANV4_9PSEU|nr:acyl-CoA dehydrogenase family protein [Crossiella equi]MBP2478077.1 alkylation response protein AidB-like acyl-CoA dehydrogenase [Crossiella equi]
MPIAATAEQHALRHAVLTLATRADAVTLTRTQEHTPGAWRAYWPEVTTLGLCTLTLPEHAGGAGGTPEELAVALSAAAESLCPGPLLPTALTALLLTDLPGAKDHLPRLATGTPATTALPGTGLLDATPTRTGLRLTGTLTPVLGATPDALLLLPTTEGWVILTPGEATAHPLPATDLTHDLARLEVDLHIPPTRLLPTLTTDQVRDRAAILAAAEAEGLTHHCLTIATKHAKTRHQFGRPIGAFQAVKHLCAEMLCRSAQATAVTQDAARALAESSPALPLSAATAAALSLEAALANAQDCIQVLGGQGFTWDHNAHLYLRRALTLRHLFPGTHWRTRAATLAVAGVRREVRPHLPATDRDSTGAGAAGPGPAEVARTEVAPVEPVCLEPLRADLRAEVARIARRPEPERRAALVDAGLFAPHWPRPYGRDCGPAGQLLVDEELTRAGLTRPDLVIGGWAAPTLLRHGTPSQRDRFVRATLTGEVVWCQLFSEPEAGSDLAGLRTRAIRVDGGWRLTGQKVWTSLADRAQYAICLARTDPEAPRHRGLTYFLVNMRAPGLTVRPLREITGELRFAEVFLDEVFVPDEDVVGEPGQGWRIARGTLADERVAMSRGSALGEAVEELLTTAADSNLLADPVLAERVGGLVVDGLALSLLDLRATRQRLSGGDPGPEAGVRKLVGVRHRQAVAEVAAELSGPSALLRDTPAVHHYLLSRCLSIAGGTTQVLLTLVGERVLGLPREGGDR